MRGDDVIGIPRDAQSQRLQFLKTEAKSRATLTAQVLILDKWLEDAQRDW